MGVRRQTLIAAWRCDRCALEYLAQEEAQLIEKLPAVRAIELADTDIFDLIGRAKLAIHSDFVAGQAGPMGRTAAGFARMKRQHLIAPNIGNRAAFRGI